jgi:transcriptional regulator of acetoin/glycerol metabolism
VRPQDLPDQILSYQISSGASEPQDVNLDEPQTWLSLAEVEADHVRRVLDHTKGNKQAAIRLLKIDRKTIERMIKRHDINIRHNIEIK